MPRGRTELYWRTKRGYWRQMNGWEQAEKLVGYTQVWIEESIHRNALM